MPDVSIYPSGSAFPQAAPQNNLASDPLRLIGALNALQEFQLRNKQFPALAQQPAATLQGSNIANVTAEMQQQDAARKTIAAAYGTGLSGFDKPSADDVHSLTAYIARSYPEIAVKYPTLINATADAILKHPQGIRTGAALLLNTTLSPEAASERVTAPPGPSGEPRTQPLGSANIAGAQPVGQAPGEADIQTQSAARASKLQATAGTTAQYHADLDNLRQESKVLENLGGPSFEVEKKLNQLSHRIGGFGVTMTADQLKAGESFDKIANQISLNQSSYFHGSDASLHTVVGANPSTSMSAYGREGVIDMLQGNQDAIDVSRKLWLDARRKGAPASSYDDFVDQLSKTLDPRTFQFNRLSRENQQKFLSQMDAGEIADFEQRYRDAMARGWVRAPKKAQ